MKILSLLLVLFLSLSTGCIFDTVSSRIQERQSLFSSYPPEVQARLEQGQIRLGDTPDQVWFVYGEPTEKMRRTSLDGDTETWIYKILAYAPSLYPTARSVTTIDPHGHRGHSYYIDNTPEYTYREVRRVEFSSGHVTAIQSFE